MTKTAYQTHFLTSKALHQQPDAVAVPPSRGSTVSRQHAHRVPASPSDKSSNTVESDHLPPILPLPLNTFRRVPDGVTSTHGFQLYNNTNTKNELNRHQKLPHIGGVQLNSILD